MNVPLRNSLLTPCKWLIDPRFFAAALIDRLPDLNLAQLDYRSSDVPKSYKENMALMLTDLRALLAETDDTECISLSLDFNNDQLPHNSIAYHPVFGIIFADSRWYFSSKALERDLLNAEANPAFSVHFLHVNSPGGQAWYLDRLSESLRSLCKPVFVLIEGCCASAAYYIACHGAQIFALTQNDSVGSIGVMADFYDFEGFFEQMGIKRIRANAHMSDLKNKRFEDFRKGKPEQFITEELDPLALQFIAEVRMCRKALNGLPDNDPVFRGESFDANVALHKCMIDGLCTFPQAVLMAFRMGKDFSDALFLSNASLNNILN
jgi:ClpP class serine protease